MIAAFLKLIAPFWLHIVGAVAFVIFAIWFYQYVDNRWATDAGIAEGSRRVQLLWDEAKLQQREEEAERGRLASLNYGADRANTEVVYRTVTKFIDRIVDRPVYRNQCIDDDGLRALQCAIGGKDAADCGLDLAVPKPAPVK